MPPSFLELSVGGRLACTLHGNAPGSSRNNPPDSPQHPPATGRTPYYFHTAKQNRNAHILWGALQGAQKYVKSYGNFYFVLWPGFPPSVVRVLGGVLDEPWQLVPSQLPHQLPQPILWQLGFCPFSFAMECDMISDYDISLKFHEPVGHQV